MALEAAALLAAVLVLDRGGRWLSLWTAVVIALAFTRDSLVVLVVATGWLWLRSRTRTRFALFSTSLVGTVVPGLIFGAPFREQLAYILNDYHPDPHATWSSIAHEYGGALARTLDHDLHYPFDRLALPLAIVVAVLAVAAVALLIFRSPRGDPSFQPHPLGPGRRAAHARAGPELHRASPRAGLPTPRWPLGSRSSLKKRTR